jgi:serine/threonine protein phosphatase PrpC
VADHCQERIPEELRREVMKTQGDLCTVIEKVFLKVLAHSFPLILQVDNELRLLDAENTGSTACVCLVRQEFGHKFLYVANVGDTRAVLSKNGIAERMSQDHKASDQSEVERIKSQGGIVLEGRVGGTLAITRAFGDHSL